MHNLSIAHSTLQGWIESLVAKATEWLLWSSNPRGGRVLHFWIITALMALCTFFYYVEQTPLVSIPPFNHSFFTGIHDVQRILFFVPITYAAVIFRVRGSLITSFLFLCVVLPRALLFSSYPNPLARALAFVISGALLSLLIATQVNQLERGKKARDELSIAYQKLAESYDQLRKNQEQLVQAEKLSSLGQMAASIAHEINNPLSGVLLYAQLLGKRINEDSITKMEVVNYLSKMQVELVRSARLVRNLLDFARQSPPMLSEVKLNEVVEQAYDLVTHLIELQHIEVVKSLTAPCLGLWGILTSCDKFVPIWF